MAAPEMLLRGLWASHAVPTSVTSVVDSPVSSKGDLDVSALDTVDMNSVSPTIAILEEGRHLDTVGGTGELIFQVKIVWVGIRLRDFLVLMKLSFLHDRALIKFN